jgi:hypothetical protein
VAIDQGEDSSPHVAIDQGEDSSVPVALGELQPGQKPGHCNFPKIYYFVPVVPVVPVKTPKAAQKLGVFALSIWHVAFG